MEGSERLNSLQLRLTKSAGSKPNEMERSIHGSVRDFSDCIDDLSMILTQTNLNESDNTAAKHKTDRFIPMRKCNSSFSDKVVKGKDSEDKENARGK